MKTNNKFKNSVFTMLFSEPALLRELYCALDGVSLPPDIPVSINTLENVLFMGQYNDISFEIGGKLVVLIEHQSTINPNMALRLLMYIGRVYEKIIDGKKAFSKKRLLIPQPEFFVLYNGTDSFPDSAIYRLSDSFEKLKNLGFEEKASSALELVVRVININEGRNKVIVDRCKELSEYSTFVAKARAFLIELGSREEAIREAIKYCEKRGILKEFLKLHASEVLSMLFTEFNLEDAIAVAREEAWEDGEENKALEIARNLLSEGSTPEFVQKITGLDLDTLKGLQASL
jgi:predicted transposase/invertase (TIGR01784 family)